MKETHYKLKHRVTALFAAAVMLCSMLPGAAFAEEPTPQPTEETVQMEQQTEPSETDSGQTDASSPDPGAATEESTAPTTDKPAEESEPYTFDGEILYADMPDAPTGSYIGSYGLPVATGETKIGLGAWVAELEQTNYLSAEVLDSDNLTLAAPLLEDTDYAIAPILAQVEYPADGSTLDLVLPDGVTLLDYYGAPVENGESLLHNEYSETSAAVLGVYVQADADFTAQLVYTAPDGSALTKTLQVAIDRSATAEYPFPDSEIAAFAERPTPAVTSGKITKVAKVNGTWLIWFNGEPAYCCTHGANGQPAGCPTYTYVNTSTVNADQCIPGDHYGNQIRIWGGLNQLSLGDADDLPAVFSADEGEEISLLDFCASIYDDVQMYIIENFPESTAAEIYLASADELLNGVETYASARGYYTYIYNPGRAGWQTVALIGPEIGEEEPEPEPVVQEYYANWDAPAQTASGSFDFSYGVRTDKIQTATLEKVDGATIEIEPVTKSGTIDGGNWSISPASKQTVTTSGHTADDNYQKNGGDAAASWSLHYAVTKTSGTRNGQVGPFTTQEVADAAANSARDTAIAELQGEAQNAVNNAMAAAKATPDQVHEIGCEFARRFLADRFECTVSTHLDKGHLHNHIVVNSVSYADGKMFRNNFDTYYHGIRQVSDELCRENRLSVIETDGKGKSYDEWLSGQTGKPTIRGMVRKDVEQAIAAADSFDGFITELQNMGYTVKYGPRVEHMAVRHKDAQRNIRIDRLDPRFSETALREYYRQLHRMPTEMQQEYRQEYAPAKPKWQPTELQPTVRRARYRGKLPRRYPKVSGFMACYYHYCALLRKAYHGKSTKCCYFLLREDFLLFSRYQQQTKFLWENHIETMDELLAYKENAEVQIQQLALQRKVLYRQKREPERAAREEKIKSLTQQMKALRHEVYICSDIETDAAEVQEKLRQAELAAQEERNEVKQDEQRRRSSRSDGAGSLTGYRGGY